MNEPALKRLTLSVRDFVSPLEMEGSLGQSRTFSLTGNLKQLGQQIHTQIQSERKLASADYVAEKHLQKEATVSAGTVVITGRADGLFDNPQSALVEEIKTSTQIHALLHELTHNLEHPYILQTKMYGWILQNVLQKPIEARLLLVNALDPEERMELTVVPLDEQETWENFELWVQQRCHDLLALHEQRELRQRERKIIGADLFFPFENPRKGQIELCNQIQNAIDRKTASLVQAPTGLGKTMAVLFPHLKTSLLEGRQVFYITPKNSQHILAEDAVEKIRQSGQIEGRKGSERCNVRSVSINAKEKSCLKDEVICDPRYCEYAKDYYSKLKEHDLLSKVAALGVAKPADFKALGLKYEVCPFELSLDATSIADVVICDYNYVFAPNAALVRYFEEEDKNHLVHLVIDEAHNLHARAMEHYSPVLSEQFLETLKVEADAKLDTLKIDQPTAAPKLKKRLSKLLNASFDCLRETAQCTIGDAFVKESRLTSSQIVEPVRDQFFKTEAAWGRLLSKYAEYHELMGPKDPLFQIFKQWTEFCGILRLGGPEFVFTWQELQDSGTLVSTCCDASRFLKQRLAGMAAVTAFSATLKPFEFYARVSGFEQIETLEADSPFPFEHRKTLIVPQVSTTYQKRRENYAKIGEIINRVVAEHPGNYFVFFPSYDFLRQVETHVNLPNARVFSQMSGLKNEQIQDLLAQMRNGERNVVVLTVQGGSLAEGIDLPGDQLVGAFVIGPALPALSLERECVRAYYDRVLGKGFEYAYVFPAMTRVVQAAGRVIRTPEDQGLIVLCCRRFLDPVYAQCLPRSWYINNPNELVSASILKDVRSFWSQDEAHNISQLSDQHERT